MWEEWKILKLIRRVILNYWLGEIIFIHSFTVKFKFVCCVFHSQIERCLLNLFRCVQMLTNEGTWVFVEGDYLYWLLFAHSLTLVVFTFLYYFNDAQLFFSHFVLYQQYLLSLWQLVGACMWAAQTCVWWWWWFVYFAITLNKCKLNHEQ